MYFSYEYVGAEDSSVGLVGFFFSLYSMNSCVFILTLVICIQSFNFKPIIASMN